MPIHHTVTNVISGGALNAAIDGAARLPEGCSPSIREAAQVNAAIAHVARELYDIRGTELEADVLLELAQLGDPGPEAGQVVPHGAGVRPNQCEAVSDTGGGLRRCIKYRAHDGAHAYVGVVS